MEKNEKNYVSPSIEVVIFETEQGFADSGSFSLPGWSDGGTF